MKGSEHFKTTIKAHLDAKAQKNELFAAKYSSPDKNIDDCITYLLNTIQKSGINGFTDDEVYSMAIHYYEEANVDPGKEIECQVVVNHQVELTEEEKAELKEQARKKVIAQTMQDMKIVKKSKPATAAPAQTSLF